MKAQIAFWLLAATDGHAKNFSVFLLPGGGFRLTPLYDVMTTQPLFDAGQLRRNQMRLAMAAGENRHYRLHEIMPRHFLQTAAQIGMSLSVVNRILHELNGDMPVALEAACKALPGDFPEQLRDAIVGGAEQRLRLITAGT